ncbi:hypothetical protein NLU13_8025 [Sarocladium strictum]|uniref:Uncharacterized protein n=1 Tax=Sarocladium strictum TaxID=5046 RepID=A0AA39GCA7_SARSR|nr:hypothetical protein NLU13_8025 [Sarocladium strictum]
MDHTHLLPVPRTERPVIDHQDEHASRRDSSAARYSYETGESSATGSLRGSISNGHSRISSGISAGGTFHGGSLGDPPNREVRSRRKGRQTSNHTFLLHDAVAAAQDRGSRRQSRNMPPQRPKAIPRTPENGRLSTPAGKSTLISPDTVPRSAGQISVSSSEDMSQRMTLETSHDSTSDQASSPVQPQSVDVDSTQIVNMALNLSESRRIASTRRNVSRTHPPALAPLPDVSQGGSLRQHLQQQRKSSRGGSPRPAQPSSPRIPYGTVRTSSPLQSGGYEAGKEAPYRWHFTPSTLARAQKAKEQLELMAQYRRLLEHLPPLTPEHSRPLTTPPSTPAKGVKFGGQRIAGAQGRQYNPLQYIRNRKMRARERKVIDGEAQGFSDVDGVRAWVEAIACNSASSSSEHPSYISCQMPAYPGATETDSQTSPDPGAKAAARARRPRVDWFFDPCDMIADAYWLEQDNHKQLIEDRHRRKVFPPAPELMRPVSKQAEDTSNGLTPFSIKTLDETEMDIDTPETQTARADGGDVTQVGTREKAKKKLHDLKGFHHRHTSSLHGPQDVLRLRKTSFSDLSESENEEKDGTKHVPRRARAGTLSSDPNDLLQKQMLQILAKEARENGTVVPETVIEQDEPVEGVVREHDAPSKPASRSHSRKGSTADGVDANKRSSVVRRQSPHRHRFGQFSLDLGDRFRQYSTDDDSSAPVSPQHEKSEHAILSLGNATLSPPWSRSGSPVRNRLMKTVAGSHEKHDKHDKVAKKAEHIEPNSTDEAPGKHGRHQSISGSIPADERMAQYDKGQTSPVWKLQNASTHEGHKGHRSTNSAKLRDDQAFGLRGMFKGPRIDTVLRGGVSKLGDMLWKRDGPSEAPPDAESTDESESEASRGRLRSTLSRQPSKRTDAGHPSSKHFFDEMPQFQPIGDSRHARADSKNRQDLEPPGHSRSQSRQSIRLDHLKPPDLDDHGRSTSVSPPNVRDARQPSESDISDAASSQPRITDGVRTADRRLSAIIGIPQFAEDSRSTSQAWLQTHRRSSNPRAQLSKREVARMRTLILSSGIKAMEISRRAHSKKIPLDSSLTATGHSSIPWEAIAKLSPDPSDLYTQAHAGCDLYPLAARHLSSTIQNSAQRWQSSVDHFTSSTAPTLHRRLGTLRSRLVDDLSEQTREAADLADETGRDIALSQPLKVKHVQDLVEKLMRRRRRRFRWVRRGLWLGVEWVLVGFMWYVWFVVTILRLVSGVGKGISAGIRWLLWL